jgi:hypothetical protein
LLPDIEGQLVKNCPRMREIGLSRFWHAKQNVKCASLCYVWKNIVSVGGKMIEDSRVARALICPSY